MIDPFEDGSGAARRAVSADMVDLKSRPEKSGPRADTSRPTARLVPRLLISGQIRRNRQLWSRQALAALQMALWTAYPRL
jgi:hypothetical protein